MHPATKTSKSDSHKHVLLQLAVVGLVAVGLSSSQDPLLYVRLQFAANDAFNFGCPGYPMLLLDGKDELQEFPPNRIAGFLSFPSTRIRSAASLSLSERTEDRDPASWVGVGPKLIRSYASESDEIARRCAHTALLNLPVVPAEDADAVLDFVEGPAPEVANQRRLRTELARKVVRSNPERLPEVVAIFDEFARSPDAEDRRTGSEGLAALGVQRKR